MVFFYVSMAFRVRMTPKHAKQGIFTLLYTSYIMQTICLTRNAKDPYVYFLKFDKLR